MQWSEVRRMFPDQWVLVEELASHYDNDKVCVDEIAFIKAIPDAREATDELFAAKGKRFVYHTSKEQIAIREITKPMVRRSIAGGN
ncbi:hypothetical protein [Alicyclobacillus sp. SO9]|uniref:hypothetical protein n=1 Tax=Alicyclobacillus sp. SO9 TaxID=2665646 RepID=UPI0018E77396|nr:hypothetical protein [Alicyclobacillus sp. SO9]QQE81614.1 hypothetical protein GI364_24795 [Alicyclobacillus sp. SO9]